MGGEWSHRHSGQCNAIVPQQSKGHRSIAQHQEYGAVNAEFYVRIQNGQLTWLVSPRLRGDGTARSICMAYQRKQKIHGDSACIGVH